MAGTSDPGAGGRARRRLALGLALGLLAACGHGVLYRPWSPAAAAWTQPGGGAAGDGFVDGGAEPPLRLRWQQAVGKPPLGGPLLAGPLLLQWSKAPDLFAFERGSGRRLGKRGLDDPACGPPAVAGPEGRLMLVSVLEHDKPQLRALDLVSGDVAWRQDGAVCGGVAVRGDTVFAAAESGILRALRAADGAVLWSLSLAPPLVAPPSLSGPRLYIADGDGVLVAARADSGRVEWRRELSRPVRTRAAAGPANRVFVAVDGGLHALAADTGEPLWQAAFAGLPAPGLYAAAGLVAVASSDRGLYAFDAATGARRWRCATGGTLRGAPVGTASTIYVGGGDGALQAVDAGDGSVRWRQQLDGAVRTPVALAAGGLAVTTERGTTYMLTTP